MYKYIVNYFKEIFKNEKGLFNPEAKNIRLKDILYWIIGLIFSFIISVFMVYLETWEFNWNVFALIWTGDKTENLYRGGYFILSNVSNILFLIAGFLTTYKINGSDMLLDGKKTARGFWFISFPLAIICFIIALIIY